jgi:copper(I)-binding protein
VRKSASALLCAAALAGGTVLSGCSASSQDAAGGPPRLEAGGAYMPEPVMDDMAAGFLTVENTGGTDDRLTSVTSDAAEEVELHETVDQQMRQVKSFPVPAGGELELRRGGNHLMFLGLKRRPVEGEKVTVELRFAEHDPVTVTLPVKASHHNPGG